MRREPHDKIDRPRGTTAKSRSKTAPFIPTPRSRPAPLIHGVEDVPQAGQGLAHIDSHADSDTEMTEVKTQETLLRHLKDAGPQNGHHGERRAPRTTPEDVAGKGRRNVAAGRHLRKSATDQAVHQVRYTSPASLPFLQLLLRRLCACVFAGSLLLLTKFKKVLECFWKLRFSPNYAALTPKTWGPLGFPD